MDRVKNSRPGKRKRTLGIDIWNVQELNTKKDEVLIEIEKSDRHRSSNGDKDLKIILVKKIVDVNVITIYYLQWVNIT